MFVLCVSMRVEVGSIVGCLQTKSWLYYHTCCSVLMCGLPGDRAVSQAGFFGLPGIRLPCIACTIPATLRASEAIMSEMNYGLGFLYHNPSLFSPITLNFLLSALFINLSIHFVLGYQAFFSLCLLLHLDINVFFLTIHAS